MKSRSAVFTSKTGVIHS